MARVVCAGQLGRRESRKGREPAVYLRLVQKGRKKDTMRKQLVVGAAIAVALSMPLVACGGSSSSSSSSNTSSSTTATTSSSSSSSSSFDAVDAYQGQWRGSVEMTGQTVYGTAGGSEQMLDVNLESDGTCTVVPLEAHADLLNDSGTWEGTESTITLHLDKAGDIELTVKDKNTASADAKLFEIADFDTIDFDFYG